MRLFVEKADQQTNVIFDSKQMHKNRDGALVSGRDTGIEKYLLLGHVSFKRFDDPSFSSFSSQEPFHLFEENERIDFDSFDDSFHEFVSNIDAFRIRMIRKSVRVLVSWEVIYQ